MRNALCSLILLAATTTANAQLVVGFDDTTAGVTTCYAWDFANPGAGWQPLFSDRQVWGLAADDANSRLYIASGSSLYTWDYANLGSNTPPTLVAGFTYLGAGVNFVGLAFNPTTGMLYGTRNIATEAVYEIDPTTAVATLLFTYTAADFALDGLDYNPADGMLYATDDTATNSRGLFRIDVAAQTVTFVTNYPVFAGDGGATPDIDGLAIGQMGGDVRAYFVIDNAGETGIYNLTTGLVETPMTNPWATSEVFSAGAWASTLFVAPTGSDVQITKTDTPDPVVPPGGNITYTVTVTNNGPENATGVDVQDTLPGNVNFVSVTPPGIHNAGVISAAIGDLADGASVSFDVVVQTLATGAVANTAAVTSTSQDNNQTNNSATANTLVRNFQANLSVAITDPADCTVPVGGTASYSISVNNAGPETASAAEIAITLPANASFVSSNPPGVPVGNLLTLALGDIGSGGSAPVTLDLSPTGGTTLDVSATVSSSTEDPNAGNNADSETMLIQVAPPSSAAARGVLSTIATSPTSEVPGLPGIRFSSVSGLDRPFRSANGQRWIMSADTDNATTTQDQVLLVGNGTSFIVAAQEGVSESPDGQIVGTFDTVQGINNAGQYTYSTNTSATIADEIVVKWDGAILVLVAREGELAAAVNDEDPGTPALYGSTSGSATIAEDGTVSFHTNLSNVATTQDNALLRNDGDTLVAQEGITVPGNQNGGSAHTFKAFDSGATDGQGFFPSADGTQYIVSGTINDPVLDFDRVAVVSGNVVIQENVVLPGSGFIEGTDLSSPLNLVNMESNGDWFAYGDNNDDIDWVLRNGAVVAVTDAPIHTGATELFDDAPYAQTFFFALGNAAGDYVVGGATNAANDNTNAVLVLNGESVLVRENDPVDLDNNGAFDDGVYISVFRDDFAYMSNSELWLIVRLRDQSEALCAAGDNDIGQALVRVALPADGCPNPGCEATDFNSDCVIDITDLALLLADFGCVSGCATDTDGDDDVDITDLALLLSSFGFDCN